MTTARRWQLVSFDLDGTLVDTAGEIAEAANRALAAHGLEQRPLDEITRLIGGGFHTLMQRLVGGGPDAGAVIASADEHYAELAGASALPYPGCAEALAALARAGVVLACVTNKEQHHAQRVLAATGLDDWFTIVIGGDTLAEKKPHASVLRHVALTLGVDVERAAHVGDSAIDVASARNAGFAAWVVPYGYNGGQPIADAAPDRIFDSLAAVAAHVLA